MSNKKTQGKKEAKKPARHDKARREKFAAESRDVKIGRKSAPWTLPKSTGAGRDEWDRAGFGAWPSDPDSYLLAICSMMSGGPRKVCLL